MTPINDLSLKTQCPSQALSCLSSSLHPLSFVVCLLAPEEDSLSKALVYYCFLVFRRISEYISLDLFYNDNNRLINMMGNINLREKVQWY